MKDNKTLRIELALEIKIPENAGLFQALVLAFWQFQGIVARELFVAVLKALETRVLEELHVEYPGRFQNKDSRRRVLELPFGRVEMWLLRVRDCLEKKNYPLLRTALDLPKRIHWSEDTLLPGYRVAVIQSFRESAKTVKGNNPQGRGPSHETIHRRFQEFAEKHMDPRAPAPRQPGSSADPSKYQMADGTKVKRQEKGWASGDMDMRIVLGSRNPGGTLEVLDFSLGESWDELGARIRKRFSKPPKVVVSDGEEGIPNALGDKDTVRQRCLRHGERNLKYVLYREGIKGEKQAPIIRAYQRVDALMACQKEVQELETDTKKHLRKLLREAEKAFERLKRYVPDHKLPETREYVYKLIEDGLSYLRLLLEEGVAIQVSTNKIESLMSRLALRIKRIGRRWSQRGGANMLAACLVYALHPEKYAEAEAEIKGQPLPQVSILIQSLQTAWVS